MRRWRKMTWTLIVFSGLMLAWLASTLAENSHCARQQQLRDLCKASEDAQRSNDFVIVLVLWFMGFVALSLVWFMTRPREQTQA